VVTSALALQNLSNRFWTMVLVPGTCLLLCVLMLMKLNRRRM
jgi:ABC-type dipeptide/oligopeptide/nickel transport system permease subunit